MSAVPLSPFNIVSILIVLWRRRFDRAGEHVWHTAIPQALFAMICSGGRPNAPLPQTRPARAG